MFSELIESVAVRRPTNKRWGVFVSVVFQSLCLAVLILIPLICTQALPRGIVDTLLVGVLPPPADAPPPPAAPKTRVRPGVRLLDSKGLHPPHSIPAHIHMIVETVLPPDTSVMGSGNADPGGLDILNGVRPAASPVAPPPPAPVLQRVPIGGNVEAARIIEQPQPAYPILARQGHVQGNVVLHAIIDKDGRVSELQVVSGHPLLVQAALNAVKRWRYRPTFLNSEAVEVETTITVSFVLAQ